MVMSMHVSMPCSSMDDANVQQPTRATMVDGCSWVRQQTRCRHPPRLLHAGARPRLRQYAEVSPDVQDLVLQCGHAARPRMQALSGARNEAEARSWWVSHCRMRIGVPPTKFHHASQRSRDEAGERGDRCVNGARAEASEPGLLQYAEDGLT